MEPFAALAEFEEFVQWLRGHADPGEAVRLCYAYVSGGPGRLIRRQAQQTPAEFLAELGRTEPGIEASLQPLFSSYELVRFADVPSSEAQRTAAVDRLDQVVRESMIASSGTA